MILLTEQHVTCVSDIVDTNCVCRCAMVARRGIVRWLDIEGCIRGSIPLGAGKSTLVRQLERRDDVLVVRGVQHS